MNLIITGRHFDFANRDKKFITYAVARKLGYFLDKAHTIHIIIDQEKFLFKSECSLSSDLGEFFASSEHKHLRRSISDTLTKIKKEMKKKQGKDSRHYKPQVVALTKKSLSQEDIE